MRYLIFSNNQYEEARIISNLSKDGHDWVGLDKANAGVTHIIVHPNLESLPIQQRKRVASFKLKCRCDVVSSTSVLDLNADKRLCPHTPDNVPVKTRINPLTPQNQKITQNQIDQKNRKQNLKSHIKKDKLNKLLVEDHQSTTAPPYGVTVMSSRKAEDVDPDETYMAPRQWIKMLPNDDVHHAWAEQMGSSSANSEAMKNQATSPRPNPNNTVTDEQESFEPTMKFKSAVDRVIMANSFGNSFKHTREKRLGQNPFHEVFKTREKLTPYHAPEAFNRRLIELEDTLVAKREAEVAEAREIIEAKKHERREARLQSRRQAIGHFQAPATKLAMKLATRLHQKSPNKTITRPGNQSGGGGTLLTEKQLSKTNHDSKKDKPVVVDLTKSADPLTRWRAKTRQHRNQSPESREHETEDDHSVCSVDPTKISFSTAALSLQSLTKERRAKLEGLDQKMSPKNKRRSSFLERLREAKSNHRNSVTTLREVALEAASVHKDIPSWSEMRGEVSPVPVIAKPSPTRPRTAPTRTMAGSPSKDLAPLRHQHHHHYHHHHRHHHQSNNSSNPPSDRQSAREFEEKENKVALIIEAIKEGCGPEVKPVPISLTFK